MTTIKSLITPTATITRIATLAKGDVYKRLATGPYGSTGKEIVLGIVADVMHNGDDAAVVAIEHRLTYSSSESKLTTLTDADDLAIFSATPEEVEGFFGEVAICSERTIERKRREIADEEEKLARISEMVAAGLTAPATESVES